MTLTKKRKAYIDGLSYIALLGRWRFARAGDPWFQGETGDYWAERLTKLRDEDKDRHVRVSKSLGW